MESLESRKLLAATTAAESADSDPGVFVSDEYHTAERFQVTSVLLSINGETRPFDVDAVIPLDAGDELQLAGIEYATGEALEGVLAIESYLSKLPADDSASVIDYGDGRFGGGEAIAVGPGSHGGADGSWTVQAGWDRLTISLVRYFGDSAQLENISRLRLQVGQPDFAIDPAMIDSIIESDFVTGERVDFAAMWSNIGPGRYHNYLEVDVTNLDVGSIDWVGVSVANADDGGVNQTVQNHNGNDPFDVNWVPQIAGEYEILIAVDPENLWNESDESNNRVKLQVTVSDPPSLQNVVFALDRHGRLATYNTDTRETISIGQNEERLVDLAMAPDRTLYAISSTSLYTVDTDTGAASRVGDTGRDDLAALTFLADGSLVTMGEDSEDLFAVDLATGGLSSMGSTGYEIAGDLAVHKGELRMSTDSGWLVTILIENDEIADVERTIKMNKKVDGLASTDAGLVLSRGNRLYHIDLSGRFYQVTNLGPQEFSTIKGLASINQS